MAILTADDEEILSWLVKLHFAQASHLAAILNRSTYVIGRRLRALGPSRITRSGEEQEGLGFVASLQPSLIAELVCYPTQKTLDHAVDRGWLERRVRAPEEKSIAQLEHEMVITDLILALRAVLPGFIFTRHRHKLLDRFGDKEEDRINPDLFFAFEANGLFPSFFVEVENSREHHYRGGLSERIRKMKAYARYPSDRLEQRLGIDDFYVLTLLPSAAEVKNFIGKLEKSGGAIATRKFWAAEYGALSHLGEPVFHTPGGERRSLVQAG